MAYQKPNINVHIITICDAKKRVFYLGKEAELSGAGVIFYVGSQMMIINIIMTFGLGWRTM